MLNFDPRQWLAEHADPQRGHFVATVATVAATSPEIENRHSGIERCQPAKSVLNVQPATAATPATVSDWARQLSRLDPCQPPDGLRIARWQTLYDDAVWLLENFGKLAARDGWSDADLFGLWPGKPYWGGIADRLRGSRSLVMDADRASWRSSGQVERFNRGAYPDLSPFWRDQDPNSVIEVIP